MGSKREKPVKKIKIRRKIEVNFLSYLETTKFNLLNL